MINISTNSQIFRAARMYFPDLTISGRMPIRVKSFTQSFPQQQIRFFERHGVIKNWIIDVDKLKNMEPSKIIESSKYFQMPVRGGSYTYQNCLEAIVGRVVPKELLLSKYGLNHNNIVLAMMDLFNGFNKDFRDKMAYLPSSIKLDLSGAIFDDSYLEDFNLSKANLSNSIFNYSVLKKINLQSANLSGAKFYRSVVMDSDLSNSNIKRISMNETILTRANIPYQLAEKIFKSKDGSILNCIFENCPIVKSSE